MKIFKYILTSMSDTALSVLLFLCFTVTTIEYVAHHKNKNKNRDAKKYNAEYISSEKSDISSLFNQSAMLVNRNINTIFITQEGISKSTDTLIKIHKYTFSKF